MKKKKKLNLKSFNFEEAKAGKPVCTRDGRKARIICFDRVNSKPILALVDSTDGKGEDIFGYFANGKRTDNVFENSLDLIMLSEKRSGWVNVYKGNLYDTESEAKKAHLEEGYIDTIKIEWRE